MNQQNQSRSKQATNPFSSLQPNKSGIIANEQELSDFSHFLSAPNSPTNAENNDPSPCGSGSTNSDSNHDGSQKSQFASSQSRSNQNVVIKERTHAPPPIHHNHADETTDDFIFASLQRYNSMTMPAVDDTRTTSTTSQLPSKHKHKQQQQPPQQQRHEASGAHPSKKSDDKLAMKQRTLHSLPFDWCLKKTLYFVSDESLNWCCNIPLKLRNAALHGKSWQSLQIDSEQQQRQFEFYQTLLYHEYPSDAWDASQLSTLHAFYLRHASKLEPLQKVKSAATHSQAHGVTSFADSQHGASENVGGELMYNSFIDRLCEWMESFHSLYTSFRQHFCRYFYVHFPHMFNIVFCFAEESGNNPRVIITNTHQSFRNTLQRNNIVFTTPMVSQPPKTFLATENENEAENGKNNNDENETENDDDLNFEEFERNGINVRRNEKRTASGLGLSYNNRQRSVTLIEGAQNVHNFYDFLQNDLHRLCLSIKKCHDVPLLFCDQTFLNAKCCLVSMSKNLSGFDDNKNQLYTMQLDGVISPHMQYTIAKLLACSAQNATISSQLHNSMVQGINYCSTTTADTQNLFNTDLFSFIQKIQINAIEQKFVVHLQ
eukprot:CAMPEP_0202705710 /NCGR_PEP_ID=MMETSP1385-20130828/18225_1 /ASSEMBLY_ACC=CAM_ASM_000861 /TAXON_ID=933848 /ORGANISM="Elphidium margaritaceum" /LENGTH=600 /DNA_ID=CAMNT_0049364007 /DNA_START=190 /DNA_END=1992 /DNA_ORIENTATION=+